MNIAYIKNASNDSVCGVIGYDPQDGDIAYFSNNNELLDCVDIIISKPLYAYMSENKNGKSLVKKKEITIHNEQYLSILNYNLPYPWEIIDIKKVDGDVEDIVKAYSVNIS